MMCIGTRGGGGYFHQIVPQKLDFLYTNFWPNFPPISLPFLKEKHPILIKLSAFYNDLPKIPPIYVIWAPSSLIKPLWYTKFSKKAPQKAGTYIHIPCQCETPPPLALLHRLLSTIKSRWQDYVGKICLISHWNDFCLIPLGKCISLIEKSYREMQKNSIFKIFESTVYITSLSMPLIVVLV